MKNSIDITKLKKDVKLVLKDKKVLQSKTKSDIIGVYTVAYTDYRVHKQLAEHLANGVLWVAQKHKFDRYSNFELVSLENNIPQTNNKYRIEITFTAHGGK